MSNPIVTLPTNSNSGLPYFPASSFAGLKLDVKRTASFANTISTAASGRETGVSWREMPTYEFEIDFEYLDGNNYTTGQSDFDKLYGLFQERHGNLLPFYLNLSQLTLKTADYAVTGQTIGTGDGSTINFQLCRTVGTYLEPLQVPDPDADPPTIYVAGVKKTATTDYTLLTKGIIQFVAAPASGALITADIDFVYCCRFDAEEQEFDQWAKYMLDCQSLKLRTVIL
jgi:uncharacterized protein (TIGR02217 family)